MYENGSRPGPLENAKITRLEQAVYSERNKRWTLLVDEHKTTRHQGPAEIVMDERLFSYVKLYVEHLRPCFVASGVENVFIKDDGQGFRKGTIGRRVREVFWRAGVRHDVTVTATKIRKLFSSAAEMSPTKKRAINAHMKHKESTADSNYVLKVNTDKASAMHALMCQIIDQPSAAEVERKSALPLPTTGSSSDSEDEVPLGQILGLPGDKAGSGAEAKLDAGDKVVIRSVFKKEMEAGQLLSRHQVRTKMRNDKHLRQYVVHKKKVKKIADFLRYETNTIRQLHHLEDQDDDAGSAVLTLTLGSRRQWSTTSTEVISNYFTTFPKMPQKTEVLRLFSEHPVLCHILKAEGPERCYDKVKNIFRKRSLK